MWLPGTARAYDCRRALWALANTDTYLRRLMRIPPMSPARHSGAGSAVVANGEQGTREGRLLSWADEISALVATQRDDLRRSRMELVAAQEVRHQY